MHTIMAPMVCFGNGNPSSMHVLCIPSTPWKITKLHFGLVPTSLSLKRRHALGHVSRPIICESSADPGASQEGKPNDRPKSFGQLALQSLLEVTSDLASTGTVGPIFTPPKLPPSPSTHKVKEIKMYAMRLMGCGKAKEAVRYMEKVYDMYKKDSHTACDVKMALVEILIYQQEFEQALNYLNDPANQPPPSDTRVYLYKAIIYPMSDDFKVEEAKKLWEEYVEVMQEFSL